MTDTRAPEVTARIDDNWATLDFDGETQTIRAETVEEVRHEILNRTIRIAAEAGHDIGLIATDQDGEWRLVVTPDGNVFETGVPLDDDDEYDDEHGGSADAEAPHPDVAGEHHLESFTHEDHHDQPEGGENATMSADASDEQHHEHPHHQHEDHGHDGRAHEHDGNGGGEHHEHDATPTVALDLIGDDTLDPARDDASARDDDGDDAAFDDSISDDTITRLPRDDSGSGEEESFASYFTEQIPPPPPFVSDTTDAQHTSIDAQDADADTQMSNQTDAAAQDSADTDADDLDVVDDAVDEETVYRPRSARADETADEQVADAAPIDAVQVDDALIDAPPAAEPVDTAPAPAEQVDAVQVDAAPVDAATVEPEQVDDAPVDAAPAVVAPEPHVTEPLIPASTVATTPASPTSVVPASIVPVSTARAGLPTLADFQASQPQTVVGPATIGVRGGIRRVTGGLISPRPNKKESRHREAVASVTRSLSGPRTICVINPKGGAHKTTATMLIASTFGLYRGGYTLAWDNNETRGTLGWRAHQTGHTNTAVDLLRDIDRFSDTARVGDLDNYVRSQAGAQFDVLASDEDAAASSMIDDVAFNRLHDALQRFYRIMVIDTGNNMRASNWEAAIAAADQLVIVSAVREDTAASAAWMVEGLVRKGQEEKLRNAVTVLSSPDKNTDAGLRSRLVSHFGTLTRDVVEVPYEPGLVSGGGISLGSLSPTTREAWLTATATIANGL